MTLSVSLSLPLEPLLMHGFCLDLALELHLSVRRGDGYLIAGSAQIPCCRPVSRFMCMDSVSLPLFGALSQAGALHLFDSRHSSILLGNWFLIHDTLYLRFMYCIITILATRRHLTHFMNSVSLHCMKNCLEGVGHCWYLMIDNLANFPVSCTATVITRGFGILILILKS